MVIWQNTNDIFMDGITLYPRSCLKARIGHLKIDVTHQFCSVPNSISLVVQQSFVVAFLCRSENFSPLYDL